jgi:hypothetical protein
VFVFGSATTVIGPDVTVSVVVSVFSYVTDDSKYTTGVLAFTGTEKERIRSFYNR